MPKKPLPSTINQTAIGNNNIQAIGSHNVITRITNFVAGDTEAQRALRNRRAMLELVKNTWIKGVLERSLYNEVLIELGLEERPDAVEHPWDMQMQMPNQPNRTLPTDTSISNVFDDMNGAMLILGEPGSGKTTILLELARDCIARAQDDDNQPIPVIFNLSSWSERQTIESWLVNELVTKYSTSKKIAHLWVENDELLLLLDGLDEVKFENRQACVRAINDFRQKHGLSMPIAVCSRVADYTALTSQLNLQGAVFLQPLTHQQLEQYFEEAGPELKGVYEIVQHDVMLQELMKLPLMLSVLTLAYRGLSVEVFASEIIGTVQVQGKRLELRTIEIRRDHLFDTYIQQMFKRAARTKSEDYSPEQTKRWLAWLAQKMITHNVVPYLLENMQPKWLGQEKQQSYKLAFGLGFGLIVGLIFGIVPAIMGDMLTGLCLGPSMGLTLGLSAWLLFGHREIGMVDSLTWGYLIRARNKSFFALVITLMIAIIIIGLSVGLVFGLIGLIFGGGNSGVSAMTSGLLLGLIFGPVFLLISGLTPKTVSRILQPGQRIYLSIRNFLIAIPLIGLSLGLPVSFLLRAGLKLELFTSWFIGVFLGLISGLILGLRFGGLAVIQHYTLRLIIARNNLLPWRLIPFLDYCTERIFLRRVGGGYIFVHRLLMEHFAAMYSDRE